MFKINKLLNSSSQKKEIKLENRKNVELINNKIPQTKLGEIQQKQELERNW